MAAPLRVLLVEDSEEDAELLCLELERNERPVSLKRVDTEQDFLAALGDQQWDIIISDYAMPQFDGLAAFDLYRGSGLDIPFIFVSGALGEERAVKAMKAGARDYILKGNLERLNAAIDREVTEAASRREKREAEAANAREQRRLAVALRATGAGVFEFRIPDDGRGYCNERLVEILDCSLDELRDFERLGGWLAEQVHPEDRETVRQYLQNLVHGRDRHYAAEFRLCRQDGSWRDLWWLTEIAERDGAGTATDVVSVVLDRTEHRLMEEQFRQAQKMEAVGRLAGGVAHDFNNLLTVILNFGEFVLEGLETDSTAHEDMREVLAAARRAGKVTSQLLAFSRRQPVDPKVINVNGLIADVDKMLGRLLGEDVELKTELEPELWNVRIDCGCLEQVVVNLAINARDAMPAGGVLTVATRNIDFESGPGSSDATQVLAGQHVAIVIKDTGAGMDAATQKRAFEPFFTTKGAGKGTGLGLATCYGIVKQAGGFIRLESEPDRGTTFTILLPRVWEDAAEPHRPTLEPERATRHEVVLVVEDELPVRKLVSRVLANLGYATLEATNGLEALEIATSSAEPVHLVLTDVVMPKMNGPKLAEELQKLFPSIKVLFMSGHTGTGGEPEDSMPLLHKPFSPQALAEKLREVLDGQLDRGPTPSQSSCGGRT